MEREIAKIREMIELPLTHPEIFKRLGMSPPKGVLMHGLPGLRKDAARARRGSRVPRRLSSM